ncbi:MAG: SufS family cysteine desulfurase [Gammaproteobacteria bacterium]
MTGNIVRHIADRDRRFDSDGLRADFPILHQHVHGKPLAYLDNAATTQKPRQVIEAVDHYYRTYNANIHRGVHTLSEQATVAFENARRKIQKFINAPSWKEIIFTRGTTEAINLVAQAYGRPLLRPGDEIIISEMEHHSNIVPWQLLAEQTGAVLRAVSINDSGELLLDEYEKLLGPKTRLVSLTHVSNALGTVNPVKKIIEMAHAHGAIVLIDGAQAVAHAAVDVQALDCDFYVFSGHKLYGPTGTGVLYGKEKLLDAMPPWHGGGDMIKAVTLEKTVFNDLPYKFEAGTPHIAGMIGLGAAIDYVARIGLDKISAHEDDLTHYATDAASGIKGLTIIGTARHKLGILSFTLAGIHPHDVGTILDHEGIAVRTGHHCAMPVMEHFGVPATTRASFACYNTRVEIDRLMQGLERCREIFT